MPWVKVSGSEPIRVNKFGLLLTVVVPTIWISLVYFGVL